MDEVKLSQIAQKLWDVDLNRFMHVQDFEIDLQKSTVRQENGYKDRCEKPLFKEVNDDKMRKILTYEAFIRLLDNYRTHVGQAEEITHEELNEQNAFIDACMGTCVMQEAFRFLINEKIVKNNLRDFKTLLMTIWFQMYSRNARNRVNDSCAFEHVFVGEKNEEGAIGCHNWLQYYLLEQNRVADYYGYMPNLCLYSRDKRYPDMISVQFNKDGSMKAMGSFLLGVSPEFELALYTIIYLCAQDETTRLTFANMTMTFYCYKMQRFGKTVLSTVYPAKN